MRELRQVDALGAAHDASRHDLQHVAGRIAELPAAELLDADEIFLATTAGGIMPASRIDSHIMGNDRPGPISMRLRERFWEKRGQGWHATPVDYAEREAA